MVICQLHTPLIEHKEEVWYISCTSSSWGKCNARQASAGFPQASDSAIVSALWPPPVADILALQLSVP
jgi:hypothetical protein